MVEQLRHSGLSKQCIAILGMAFKADSDDNRESLSLRLRNLLQVEAREVLRNDPYVQGPDLVPLGAGIEHADVVVLSALHSVYLQTPAEKVIIDIWNFWSSARDRLPEPFAATQSVGVS